MSSSAKICIWRASCGFLWYLVHLAWLSEEPHVSLDLTSQLLSYDRDISDWWVGIGKRPNLGKTNKTN